MLLDAKGNLDGAEPLCRRALAIDEAVHGPSRPSTGRSVNNLAGLLKEMGQSHEAATELHARSTRWPYRPAAGAGGNEEEEEGQEEGEWPSPFSDLEVGRLNSLGALRLLAQHVDSA